MNPASELMQEATKNGLGIVLSILGFLFTMWYVRYMAQDGARREDRLSRESLLREDRLLLLIENNRKQQDQNMEIIKNLGFITTSLATVAKVLDDLRSDVKAIGNHKK